MDLLRAVEQFTDHDVLSCQWGMGQSIGMGLGVVVEERES